MAVRARALVEVDAAVVREDDRAGVLAVIRVEGEIADVPVAAVLRVRPGVAGRAARGVGAGVGRGGAAGAEKLGIAVPEIERGAGAVVDLEERNSALRAGVDEAGRPAGAGVPRFEDLGADGHEEHVVLVRRDGERALASDFARPSGEGGAAVGRALVPIIAADVDDAVVVDDDVADVEPAAVARRRIGEVPGRRHHRC